MTASDTLRGLLDELSQRGLTATDIEIEDSGRLVVRGLRRAEAPAPEPPPEQLPVRARIPRA